MSCLRREPRRAAPYTLQLLRLIFLPVKSRRRPPVSLDGVLLVTLPWITLSSFERQKKRRISPTRTRLGIILRSCPPSWCQLGQKLVTLKRWFRAALL